MLNTNTINGWRGYTVGGAPCCLFSVSRFPAHLDLTDEAPPLDELAQPPASFESLWMECNQRWGTIDFAE